MSVLLSAAVAVTVPSCFGGPRLFLFVCFRRVRIARVAIVEHSQRNDLSLFGFDVFYELAVFVPV